ncbi:MAG: molybdopterin-binding oxidoreductase, partial [Actinomycetes bacterium]
MTTPSRIWPADTEGPTRDSAWVGGVSGVVAAVAGLGAAELFGGIARARTSPVFSVGDRGVDLVPPCVKDWAIATFGTSDKVVLLGGVLVLLGVGAACTGVVALRRGRPAAALGVAVFTAIGVVAS